MMLSDHYSGTRAMNRCLNRCWCHLQVINSVIMDDVTLGDHAHIQNTIVCRGSVLHDRCSLRDCQVSARSSMSIRSLASMVLAGLRQCCYLALFLLHRPRVSNATASTVIVGRMPESQQSCVLRWKVGAGYVVAEGAEVRDEVLARAPRVSAT